MSLQLEIKLLKSDGKLYKHELFSTTEDICKLYDKAARSNVIIRMLPLLKQNAVFPEKCPMTVRFFNIYNSTKNVNSLPFF